MTEFKDGGDPQESANSGEDEPGVADSVAVDRPMIEMIKMRWQPCEHDRDDHQGNENPATGGIFPPALSQTAAPGKCVSDCAGQCQNDHARTRRMGKECCPIPPPPNGEREKRERAGDSKRQVLDGAFQNKKERRENATRLKC